MVHKNNALVVERVDRGGGFTRELEARETHALRHASRVCESSPPHSTMHAA